MTRLLVWPALPIALAVVCVLIKRYQRRQLAWLDRIDELRRDEAA